jgi:8-oxo-dGTP pyrophosphatase MutT (NUDIX family)
VAGNDAPTDQECVEAYLYAGRPPRILIFRRPPDRDRIWVPVSGKVDPSDTDLESALRRELREETGFGDLVRLFYLDWSVPFEGPDGRRWRLHAYGAELPGELVPTLSREHEEFEWVEPAEAIRRLHYEDNREAVRRLVDRLRGPPVVPAQKP